MLSRVRGLPWREVERPTIVMVWLAGLALATQAVYAYVSQNVMGADSHAYWLTGHTSSLYSVGPGSFNDAYLYSPAFAQVVWPLTLLPWPVFCGVWMAGELAAFAWLLRPLGWRWVAPLTLICASEWTIGNVVPFLAIFAVLGIRRAGWWAGVVLIKPSMALGPVWFAVRGEWRKVAISVAVTAALVLASLAIAPNDWADWLNLLTSSDQAAARRGLVVRIPLALLLTVIAARRNLPALMPLALLLAMPVFSGAASLTILAATPRLLLAGEARPLSQQAPARAPSRGRHVRSDAP